jgi:hypothetical protein
VIITVGGPFTVSIAAFEVAVPAVFVKTARYCLPVSTACAVKLYVVDVAPEMLLHDVPPLVFTCHCTLGVGLPLAAAVKLAV